MNIGIIISAFTNGGAQRVAITLSNWLNKNGHKTIIIALNESSKNKYDSKGINIVSLPNVYSNNKIIALRKFESENNLDLYLVLGVPLCIYVIPALYKAKAKVIVSERNDPKNFQGKGITKVLSRFLMRFADGFVFQTNDARDYYEKYLRHSIVIPNPIADMPNISNRIPNENRRHEIVTAGRLVSQKNQSMLIKAFKEVEKECPDYILSLYGEGILEGDLKELSIKLGIDKKVYFHGSVNDLHQRIIDSELFVLSSDFEGMPNVLMETMAMGLTCISTDCPCGGPRELITSNYNGVLVPVNNYKVLSREILNCIKNKAYSNMLGNNAMQVRDKYDKNTVCKIWFDYFDSIVNS